VIIKLHSSHEVVMHRSSAFLSLAILIALNSLVFGQGLDQRAIQIRAAMDARDFDRAEQLLNDLRSTDPETFALNNYDYLLGRLAERQGHLADAMALYLGVIQRRSVLSSYALWHLSSIARASGDLAAERQYLSRLLASDPGSGPATDARSRFVDNLLESGDYKAAAALLRPLASASGAGRSAMAKLGQAYLKAGDSASAREVFTQLESASRDDYALAAALGLDQLDQAAGTALNEFECVRRAHIYVENRHWAEARRRFLDVVERFPQSPNMAEAIYQIGFSFYREDQYPEAIKWFDRAHTEFPTKKEGEQGYYWVGTALQKARQYTEAAARYSDFINAYPNSEFLARAYLNIVDCYRYIGDDEEATRWAGAIEQRFAGQPMAAVGIFDKARIALAQGKYDSAIALLTRLQGSSVNNRQLGSPGRGEVEFLRAYAIEQAGRLGEAVNLYLAIPDVRDDYFGRRATIRLQALASTDRGHAVIDPLRRSYLNQAHSALSAGRYLEAKDAATHALRLSGDEGAQRDSLDILKACYSELPAYSSAFGYHLTYAGRGFIARGGRPASSESHSALAAEFLFLGVYDEGSAELRMSGSGAIASARTYITREASKDGNSPLRAEETGGSSSYSMAVYCNRGDQAHYAIAFAESAFSSVPRDYQLALLPRELAELLYPAPYKDVLNRHSSALGIDPRIVLSLARQESRFNPRAKSTASARGLLQFIPETALKLAGEESLTHFQLDDVYNPEVALGLATRYVSDLIKLFPDNPYAVAASYDAGEQSVERWIFRAHSSEVDPFVAEIAIPETKDYVAKVLSNYWAYSELYTKDLKPPLR
jgi:soluble lytic murein transglycosylase-like protein/TolA-binding protein